LPERLGDVKNSQNDPGKLFSLFPKVELVSFESALDETIRWYKENGKIIDLIVSVIHSQNSIMRQTLHENLQRMFMKQPRKTH
jgi:hypothetical protein